MFNNLAKNNVLKVLFLSLFLILALTQIANINAANHVLTTSSYGITDAIDNKDAETVINLTAGTYKNASDRNIEINKKVIIQATPGNDVTIDLENDNRLFNIANGGNLTLINITITNGLQNDGGAIYIVGGKININ